ncbi:hypothetical protein NC652_002361 [Populus alba x Populus x berolinensis]|nr:hypothetical protein NC652_002361 [Populus alba x Populus x berolinensis]
MRYGISSGAVSIIITQAVIFYMCMLLQRQAPVFPLCAMKSTYSVVRGVIFASNAYGLENLIACP